jgi:hypothetical protein
MANAWLSDMPNLIPIDPNQDVALEGPLEPIEDPIDFEQEVPFDAAVWWASLPDGLLNLYHDKYALFDCYDDPDGIVSFWLTDLIRVGLDRHDNPDMDQQVWLDLFQDLTDHLAPHENATHCLHQFRFSYEQYLEWIPTLTNEEMDVVHQFVMNA